MKIRNRDRAAAEAVGRLSAVANSYISQGIDKISVRQVLDLLSPDGQWQATTPQAERLAAVPDLGDADPLTGCSPVTAKPRGGFSAAGLDA